MEPKGRGFLGLTLRYPYEVRDEASYFGDIPDLKLSKEMLDLATHIGQNRRYVLIVWGPLRLTECRRVRGCGTIGPPGT